MNNIQKKLADSVELIESLFIKKLILLIIGMVISIMVLFILDRDPLYYTLTVLGIYLIFSEIVRALFFRKRIYYKTKIYTPLQWMPFRYKLSEFTSCWFSTQILSSQNYFKVRFFNEKVKQIDSIIIKNHGQLKKFKKSLVELGYNEIS